MRETVSNLDLWKFAIHLTRNTVKPAWSGPFFEAGYREFVVEGSFYNRVGEDYAPDIALVSADRWTVLELTTNSDSKTPKIEHYRSLAPEFLGPDHSLTIPRLREPPDVIVMRTREGVPDSCTQVVFGQEVHVYNPELLKDDLLRRELSQLDRHRFTHLPQVSLAFVPDSTPEEIRFGLIPSIKALFTVAGRRTTVHSMVEEGLDFLWPRVSPHGRKVLTNKVKAAMDDLVAERAGVLREYLGLSNDGYVAKVEGPPHPRSMERIEQLLELWVRRARPGRQTSVGEF